MVEDKSHFIFDCKSYYCFRKEIPFLNAHCNNVNNQEQIIAIFRVLQFIPDG